MNKGCCNVNMEILYKYEDFYKECCPHVEATSTNSICTINVCCVVLWLSFPFFPSPFLQMTQFAMEKAGLPLKYNLSFLSLPPSRPLSF